MGIALPCCTDCFSVITTAIKREHFFKSIYLSESPCEVFYFSLCKKKRSKKPYTSCLQRFAKKSQRLARFGRHPLRKRGSIGVNGRYRHRCMNTDRTALQPKGRRRFFVRKRTRCFHPQAHGICKQGFHGVTPSLSLTPSPFHGAKNKWSKREGRTAGLFRRKKEAWAGGRWGGTATGRITGRPGPTRRRRSRVGR